MFFTLNQSAALLMLASGSIVATSVPFCLRMGSIVMAASPELPQTSLVQSSTGAKERNELAPFGWFKSPANNGCGSSQARYDGAGTSLDVLNAHAAQRPQRSKS